MAYTGRMETDIDIRTVAEQLLEAASERLCLADSAAYLGNPYLLIAHDEREAPFLLGKDGLEDRTALLSRTDENDTVLTAWVRPATDSPVIGFGIDLVTLSDFEGEHGAFLIEHLLSEQDQLFVPELSPIASAASAYAFSAKEAAFKACSQPLRAWVDAGNDDLYFEVRGFELLDTAHEAGTARSAEAQAAMDLLGIRSIELMRASAGDLAVTLAFALSR